MAEPLFGEARITIHQNIDATLRPSLNGFVGMVSNLCKAKSSQGLFGRCVVLAGADNSMNAMDSMACFNGTELC